MNKLSHSIMGEHAFWKITIIDLDRTVGIEGILWECHRSEDKIHENAKIISWILIFFLRIWPREGELYLQKGGGYLYPIRSPPWAKRERRKSLVLGQIWRQMTVGALAICTEISVKNFRQMVLVFFWHRKQERDWVVTLTKYRSIFGSLSRHEAWH